MYFAIVTRAHSLCLSPPGVCPELPPLVNGTISYTGDTIPPFDPNTTATFSCNEGFVLSSNANRVCLDNGNGNALWSGESPVCGKL